jgi:N-acetylglucosamine kinase-like BadF-type ATPase
MYLIGVDGGGTKTESVVGDLDGMVLGRGFSGPSNPRNSGIKRTIINIAEAIRDSLSDLEKDALSLVIGIPAFAEEYKEEEENIRSGILENLSDFSIKEIIILSDQEIAFRSGTEEDNGVLVIAGTGSVARGWNEERDVKIGGWGWLADKGGALQVGQDAYKKTIEALDGRIKKSLLTEMILKNFNANSINDINKVVYKKEAGEVFPPLSLIVNEAAIKGDETAKNILADHSRHLAVLAKNVIEKLDFKEKFPLVIIGGMFNSDIFLNNFKEEVLSFSALMEVILPDKTPGEGALKIAIEKN